MVKKNISASPVKRVVTTAALTAMTLTGVPVAAGTMATATAAGCTPIHVVSTPGTGASSTTASTAPRAIAPNYDPTRVMQGKLGASNVSGWTTNYPASIGAISMLNPTAPANGWGTEAYSYANSVAYGVKNATSHMLDVKQSCPNTKFMLVGFSQGASVTGDVARDVSAGKVARGTTKVTPNDIATVTLFADPNRSSLSAYDSFAGAPAPVLYANPPAGKMGKNFEIISSSKQIDPNTLGWIGERQGRFSGLQGKVLSLCNPADMACSVRPYSMLRAVADFANKTTDGAKFEGQARVKYNNALKKMEKNGAMARFNAGDFKGGADRAAAAFAEAGFTVDDVEALFTAFAEVFDLLANTKGAEDDQYVAELLFQSLGDILPQAVGKAITVRNVESIVDVAYQQRHLDRNSYNLIKQGLFVARLASFAIDPFLQLTVAPFFVKMTEGLLNTLRSDILVDGLGLKDFQWVPLTKAEQEKYGTQVAQAISFLNEHIPYWTDEKGANGVLASTQATDWMTEAGRNVIAGRTVAYKPAGKQLTNASLEQGLEAKPYTKPAVNENTAATADSVSSKLGAFQNRTVKRATTVRIASLSPEQREGVTFRKISGPSWFTINANTGEIRIAPGLFTAISSYTLSFEIKDSYGKTVTKTATVKVPFL